MTTSQTFRKSTSHWKSHQKDSGPYHYVYYKKVSDTFDGHSHQVFSPKLSSTFDVQWFFRIWGSLNSEDLWDMWYKSKSQGNQNLPVIALLESPVKCWVGIFISQSDTSFLNMLMIDRHPDILSPPEKKQWVSLGYYVVRLKVRAIIVSIVVIAHLTFAQRGYTYCYVAHLTPPSNHLSLTVVVQDFDLWKVGHGTGICQRTLWQYKILEV